MEIRSYNMELAFANLQFKRLFSNIQITHEDTKTGKIVTIPVTCQFEQRSRILKNWENSEKRASMKVPMIAINRSGYARNPERLNNLHNEVKYEVTSKNRIYELLTPVPIDINYDVTIVAKYPSDVDQIASNFMIFFNNDVYVQTTHPKYPGLYMNNQVVMQDSISEEHSGEIDGSTDDLIVSTFTFVFKTYLFGGMQKSKKRVDEDGNEQYEGFTPIIQTISIGFYPTPYLSDHVEYMTDVDTNYSTAIHDLSGYYSSSSKDPFELSVNSEGLSVRVPEKEWYELDDYYSDIAPYVDRIDLMQWAIN